MRTRTAWLLIILVGAVSFVLIGESAPQSQYQELLAQVGVVIGVAPNPYNSLDAQLNAKQDQLDQQAANLAAQEAALASSTAAAADTTPTIVWYLAGAIAVLAFLVIVNFYFDWRRSRREAKAMALDLKDVEAPKN